MEIVKITKDNFKSEVLDSKVPVLVDFWATWCGPCQMQAPVLDEIAAENSGIKIGKINIDEEAELAEKEKIQVVPTFVLYKDGKAAALLEAPDSKAKMEAFIEENLNK